MSQDIYQKVIPDTRGQSLLNPHFETCCYRLLCSVRYRKVGRFGGVGLNPQPQPLSAKISQPHTNFQYIRRKWLNMLYAHIAAHLDKLSECLRTSTLSDIQSFMVKGRLSRSLTLLRNRH